MVMYQYSWVLILWWQCSLVSLNVTQRLGVDGCPWCQWYRTVEALSLSLSLSHTHTHTHTYTCIHTHICTHKHACTNRLIRTHALSHPPTHTHTHSHAHTDTLSLSLSLFSLFFSHAHSSGNTSWCHWVSQSAMGWLRLVGLEIIGLFCKRAL